MLNNDLTNAVKLHGMVPTYVSIVIFFHSVHPKHFQMASVPSRRPWKSSLWLWFLWTALCSNVRCWTV